MLSETCSNNQKNNYKEIQQIYEYPDQSNMLTFSKAKSN